MSAISCGEASDLWAGRGQTNEPIMPIRTYAWEHLRAQQPRSTNSVAGWEYGGYGIAPLQQCLKLGDASFQGGNCCIHFFLCGMESEKWVRNSKSKAGGNIRGMGAG